MAKKKFLLGPTVKLNSLGSFHVSCLLIHLEQVFESKFASGIKDADLHVIYVLRIAVLRTRGWFYYVFKR